MTRCSLPPGPISQSINPLLTVHPLARQVQRYVLLTTLARYDSTLTAQPYLARSWEWSPDRRRLTFHLETAVRWHDGRPTTARDVVWTLDAARDPATGYPRTNELADVESVPGADDSTVSLTLPPAPGPRFPISSPTWRSCRRICSTACRMQTCARRHGTRHRWATDLSASCPTSPTVAGSLPRILAFRPRSAAHRGLQRFIVVVVDEPTTKLAALTSGELDFAGIQPAHAEFVRRDPESGRADLSAAA